MLAQSSWSPPPNFEYVLVGQGTARAVDIMPYHVYSRSIPPGFAQVGLRWFSVAVMERRFRVRCSASKRKPVDRTVVLTAFPLRRLPARLSRRVRLYRQRHRRAKPKRNY